MVNLLRESGILKVYIFWYLSDDIFIYLFIYYYIIIYLFIFWVSPCPRRKQFCRRRPKPAINRNVHPLCHQRLFVSTHDTKSRYKLPLQFFDASSSTAVTSRVFIQYSFSVRSRLNGYYIAIALRPPVPLRCPVRCHFRFRDSFYNTALSIFTKSLFNDTFQLNDKHPLGLSPVRRH